MVRSWLLDLLVLALEDDPELDAAQRLRRGLRRGPLDGRGGDRPRGAAAGDLCGAVRPVRLAPGRLAGDAGGGRAAPPVRRPRRARRRPAGTPGQLAGPSRGTGSTASRRRASLHLRRLAVADFRSWERAELDLEPGVSVLVGPNGSGKTNLVEAVGYLATLGSHRVASDAPLVRRGAERAVRPRAVVHGAGS